MTAPPPAALLRTLADAGSFAEVAMVVARDAVERLGYRWAGVWLPGGEEGPVIAGAGLDGGPLRVPDALLRRLDAELGPSVVEVPGDRMGAVLPGWLEGCPLVALVRVGEAGVLAVGGARSGPADELLAAAGLAQLAQARVEGRAESARARVALSRLLHHVPGNVVLTRGPEHVVEFINESMARLTSLPVDRILGFPMRLAYPGTVEQGFIHLADRVYRSGVRFEGKEMYAAVTRGNSRVTTWHDVVYEPLRDDEGRVDGLFIFSKDVTDLVEARKEAEAASAARAELAAHLQQLQKLDSLGRLAGGVAHDFNNLLGVAAGNLELLEATLVEGSPAHARALAVRTALEHAGSLTRQLLGIAGRGVQARQAVDLAAVVTELVGLLRPTIPEGVTVSVDTTAGPVWVSGDPSQLQQVVLNLALNAFDAMRDRGGALQLVAAWGELGAEDLAGLFGAVPGAEARGPALEPGRVALLQVRDAGRGMDPATRQRLFDPFFSTKAAGRGLGLASVLGTVRALGGGIRVHSEVGRGSTFEVLLPPREAPAPVAAPSRRDRVLIVDDEEGIRSLIAAALAPLGYRPVEAGDAAEALDVLDRLGAEVAVIVLDLSLPDRGPREVFAALRARAPEVPVVLCSGLDEAEARRVSGAGADVPFLPKPFDVRGLARVVARALG